ncbi:MAG: hypothetical protein ACLTSG_04440 [Lachnospiraceae bacterium]
MRAYSKAAALALEAAGRARMAEWRLVEVSCGYPQFERVRRLLADFGAQEQIPPSARRSSWPRCCPSRARRPSPVG